MAVISNRSGREKLVSVLDIGTSKMCCIIAALEPWAGVRPTLDNPVAGRVLGFGHQRSRGIKSGVIVDLGEAEEAIRATVGMAEAGAGVSVEEVIVAVSCGRPRSLNFGAHAMVTGSVIGDEEIDRALAAGRAFAERDGRSLLHMHQLDYRIDGEGGVRNPRGMAGGRLTVDLNAVTADEVALRNLNVLIQRAFLSVSGLVATPYASGLAVLSDEEARQGALLVDLGGGTTTFGVFAEGRFAYADAVAIGGNHITFDIARALAAPYHEAERIKTLYGNLLGSNSDEHELITYPQIGNRDTVHGQVSKAELRNIIAPRVEELLQRVADRIAQGGFAGLCGGRAVLTGGTSELAGLSEFAGEVLGLSARIGSPKRLKDLPEIGAAPAFAATAGLLHALVMPGAIAGGLPGQGGQLRPPGYLRRVGQWFRESFWDEDPATAARSA